MVRTNSNNGAETIAACEYPAMLSAAAAAEFLRTARSPDTLQRANRVMAARSGGIGDAVLGYVRQLEAAVAASNAVQIFQEAHEIRGLAAMAGMEACGKIADGLCKYLDAASRARVTVDAIVVSLHSDAITRAARATDDATRLGGKVAIELAALATHKLQIVNGPKPPAADRGRS